MTTLGGLFIELIAKCRYEYGETVTRSQMAHALRWSKTANEFEAKLNDFAGRARKRTQDDIRQAGIVRENEAYRLWKTEGWTQAKIAVFFGVGKARVHQILEKRRRRVERDAEREANKIEHANAALMRKEIEKQIEQYERNRPVYGPCTYCGSNHDLKFRCAFAPTR